MNKFLDLLKKNYDPILKPTIVLLAICIVISFALSLTNKITAPKIEVLSEKQQQASMKQLVKADDFKERSFEDEFTYFEAKKADETVGYVFLNEAKGYGSAVSVMTAVAPDGKIIAARVLDASGETPGLGQNATKENFYGQFTGKTKEISVVKFGAKDQEVNAVTGATITSKAVTKAVNEALEQFEKVQGEVNADE